MLERNNHSEMRINCRYAFFLQAKEFSEKRKKKSSYVRISRETGLRAVRAIRVGRKAEKRDRIRIKCGKTVDDKQAVNVKGLKMGVY